MARLNRSTIMSALSAVRSRSLPAILGALLLAVPGLGQGAGDDEDPTAQLSKLQSLLFAYADKYMSGIAQVTFEARRKDPTNPELRLRMHSLKLVVTSSVQALVVSPNPESTLLDMMVFATLHRIAIEEDWARKLYGDAVERIGFAMRILEKEIWRIASSYLNEKQIAEVRKLIRDFKVKNPELIVISYIRFSDFASLRSKSPLVDKARSGGFLVDTSGAEKAVDEALLLAERALHYSQRLPWIMEWQIERVFYQLAVAPEVRETLTQTQGMTRSLDRFADSMEKLPQQIAAERQASIKQMASAIATERAAFFAELDSRQEMLQGTFSEVRGGLADADKLAIDLEKTTSTINEALINADKLMARFDQGPEGGDVTSEPFDINPYDNAIKDLTVAIREANTLLLSTERLTGGEGPMGDVFNRVLWTGTILILILCVAVFITMLIYRAAARHIVARSSFEYVPPPSPPQAGGSG